MTTFSFNDADVGTTTGATTPKYNLRKSSAPITRVIRFADGFEQRILFGLPNHQNPKSYNFTFDVSSADATKIEDFFDARAIDNKSFTFTPPGDEGFTKTGTYSQSQTTISVAISNHGFTVGDKITVDFTSTAASPTGTPSDGTFFVTSVSNTTNFVITATTSESYTDSGNISVSKSGAKQFVCENWNKQIPYSNRATIQATFREVFEV